LALQHYAIVENFQSVRGKRRAGRGDVDNHLCGARCRSAFGRAQAFDDAVIRDAVARKERARHVHVFGGDAHALSAFRVKRSRDIVEIFHGADVDPRLRHRDDDVRVAET
jgi:hypothetical protein